MRVEVGVWALSCIAGENEGLEIPRVAILNIWRTVRPRLNNRLESRRQPDFAQLLLEQLGFLNSFHNSVELVTSRISKVPRQSLGYSHGKT